MEISNLLLGLIPSEFVERAQRANRACVVAAYKLGWFIYILYIYPMVSAMA